MTTTEHKEECELCGGIFVQIIDDPNLAGVIPLVRNEYCDKCTKALKIKEEIEKQTQHEEWIKIRDKLLKIKFINKGGK